MNGGTEVFRWPNAGAFAGFYSFVTCANVDGATYSEDNVYKYVFHRVLDATLCEVTGTGLTGTITLDVPTQYVTVVEELDAGDAGTYEFTLTCNAAVGHDGSRDLFPDCYQGEEIHFEYVGAAEAASTTRLNPWATTVTATFS